MDFELLTIPGCPNTAAARVVFDRALALEGTGCTARVQEVTSESEAAELDFHGSPTFRAAGHDLFPSDAAPAVSCRLYPSGGKMSGLPPLDDLRAALRQYSL
ncbi:hypothetical protein V3C33_16050 [Micrococcaceae bacterium Sec5.7]